MPWSFYQNNLSEFFYNVLCEGVFIDFMIWFKITLKTSKYVTLNTFNAKLLKFWKILIFDSIPIFLNFYPSQSVLYLKVKNYLIQLYNAL